jgi:hypothetical protein
MMKILLQDPTLTARRKRELENFSVDQIKQYIRNYKSVPTSTVTREEDTDKIGLSHDLTELPNELIDSAQDLLSEVGIEGLVDLGIDLDLDQTYSEITESPVTKKLKHATRVLSYDSSDEQELKHDPYHCVRPCSVNLSSSINLQKFLNKAASADEERIIFSEELESVFKKDVKVPSPISESTENVSVISDNSEMNDKNDKKSVTKISSYTYLNRKKLNERTIRQEENVPKGAEIEESAVNKSTPVNQETEQVISSLFAEKNKENSERGQITLFPNKKGSVSDVTKPILREIKNDNVAVQLNEEKRPGDKVTIIEARQKFQKLIKEIIAPKNISSDKESEKGSVKRKIKSEFVDRNYENADVVVILEDSETESDVMGKNSNVNNSSIRIEIGQSENTLPMREAVSEVIVDKSSLPISNLNMDEYLIKQSDIREAIERNNLLIKAKLSDKGTFELNKIQSDESLTFINESEDKLEVISTNEESMIMMKEDIVGKKMIKGKRRFSSAFDSCSYVYRTENKLETGMSNDVVPRIIIEEHLVIIKTSQIVENTDKYELNVITKGKRRFSAAFGGDRDVSDLREFDTKKTKIDSLDGSKQGNVGRILKHLPDTASVMNVDSSNENTILTILPDVSEGTLSTERKSLEYMSADPKNMIVDGKIDKKDKANAKVIGSSKSRTRKTGKLAESEADDKKKALNEVSNFDSAKNSIQTKNVTHSQITSATALSVMLTNISVGTGTDDIPMINKKSQVEGLQEFETLGYKVYNWLFSQPLPWNCATLTQEAMKRFPGIGVNQLGRRLELIIRASKEATATLHLKGIDLLKDIKVNWKPLSVPLINAFGDSTTWFEESVAAQDLSSIQTECIIRAVANECRVMKLPRAIGELKERMPELSPHIRREAAEMVIASFRNVATMFLLPPSAFQTSRNTLEKDLIPLDTDLIKSFRGKDV